MQKIITIAIPTYNRKRAIYESVVAYCEMIKINNLESDLELLIVDNCSDKYDIFELLKEFQLNDNYSFLKIVKNKTNLGMAKNIIKTMELSKGEFYFFTGDDECRNYNNLAKVINLVLQNKNRYNVFISGQKDANGYKEIFYGMKKNQVKSVKNILEQVPIYYLGNGNAFVRKNCLSQLLDSKRTFLEKHPIPQVALVLQNLKINDEALLCNYNLSKEGFFEKYENNTLTSWSLNYSRFSIWYFYDKEFSLNPKFFYKRHPVLKPKNFLKLIIFMNLHYNYSDTDKEKKDFTDFFLKNKLPFWYKTLVTYVVNSKLCAHLFSLSFLIRNLIVKKKFITIKIYFDRKKKNLIKNQENHHWNLDHSF